MSRPELLSPAGSPEALEAAVAHGADAVYLGWGSFHARTRARGFTEDQVQDSIAWCHVRGVRVYVTLNTLLTDRELPLALQQARAACRFGADAVLVQDWGLFALLRAALPDFPVHASTQMGLMTSGGARILHADGCARIVAARECSREDLASLCQNGGAEIEAFVHGALCVCVSGQCAMSALIGGRSANRGRCAQPCRMEYGAGCHALSLKELNLARHIPELSAMGISCLKIEGRLRKPAYAAAVTSVYARLVRENRGPTPEEEAVLDAAFSRGGSTDGYFTNTPGPGMLGFGPASPDTPEPLPQAPDAYAVPVVFTGTIAAGVPSTLTVRDRQGRSVTVSGPVPETARSRPTEGSEVAERLGKTGGTPYRCETAEVTVEPGLRLPARAVNALRREALDALSRERAAVPRRREGRVPDLPELDCSAPVPAWTATVSRFDQLSGLLADFPAVRIGVPLEELHRPLPDRETEWCAILPRAWRDRDEEDLGQMLDRAKSLGVTGVLCGNIGHLSLAAGRGLRLYGDFGLNVMNSWSVEYLRRKGLDSVCLSFELRMAQIRDLQKILPCEAVVYGRLPLMVTENRPLCTGSLLRDRTGAEFPLLDAYGGRTEIENSRPLWLADRSDWRGAGLSFGRLRFTTETPEECRQVCLAYLNGETAPGAFTRGLYDRGVE